MEFKENSTKCAFTNREDGHCLCHHTLQKLAKSVLPNVDLDIDDNQLLKALKSATHTKTEEDVLQSSLVKKKIGSKKAEDLYKAHFKQSAPLDNSWLSNSHTDGILKQLMLEFPKKKFFAMPFQMIDFNEHNMHGKKDENLGTIDLVEKIKQGYLTFGVIINTDPHNRGGSHWFALYFELKNNEFSLEYYNSAGQNPAPSIQEFLERTASDIKTRLHLPVRIVIHRVRHQQDSYNCGLFALYYIISRLSGVSPAWFQKNSISTEKMNNFRKYLFTDK